ncbi:hypothetical protein L1049_023568 [Liquidambar formosana]|uniref:DUF7894 domain-containing protein n=1 Tax=Liquidambar formosana TaxID=63359 RepID=A0AAP0RTP4_LIQFO
MKVGPKIIFLFKDADGFGAAISDALHPSPNSSLRILQESFELSLERYGIQHCKASGDILHFIDDKGLYQVSVLLLQNYEPPILACAVNEVLASITGEESSTIPTFVAPFLVASSKLKSETKNLTANHNKALLYGVQIGPGTDISQTLATRTQKPPSSLQIHHEPLACLLQLVRVLNLPTFVLIGQRGQGQELEVLYEVGELLASTSCLCFLRDRIMWNPTKTLKECEEPWRALYG